MDTVDERATSEILQAPSGRFEDGTPLQAVEYGQLTLTLHCPRAYPPGKPLSLQVELDEAVALVGRCIGSKLQPEGHYQVRMRLTNLSRPTRLALEGRLGKPGA